MMTDNRMPENRESSVVKAPQPDPNSAAVDAAISSAVHELKLEADADEVLDFEVAPENLPLEERDA